MSPRSKRVSDRVRLLRWTLPLGIGLVALLYQVGPARWVHDHFGHVVHYGIEVLFYGTAGPLVTWLTLRQIGRWLDEKEEAEQRAADTQRYLVTITADSADAILSLDLNQLIRSWNVGAELMFGYSAQEALGQSLELILPASLREQGVLDWISAEVWRQGVHRNVQTEGLTKDGRRLALELTSTLLRDASGQATGISAILRDVTERRQHELALQRLNQELAERVEARTQELAERNRELQRANAELQELDQLKSDFVSSVSHQLSAPLTNMRGAVELVRNRCAAPNPTCVRMLGLLEGQTSRLNRLVTDVLNVSRLEAGQLALRPVAVDLAQMAGQAMDELTLRHSDRKIQLLADRPGPPAHADPDRVQEIIANLLDNALKYSPAGSPIEVKVQCQDGHVVLSVTDHGPGLPTGESERVFEKFHRLDGGDAQETYGHGLGLYICRKLVEAQGGRIWAEGTPGHGATFAFALPRALVLEG